MTEQTNTAKSISWKFPKDFWIANVMELFERAAYYSFFIVLTLYLTNIVGFTDKETGVIAGIFYAGIFFLTPFMGAAADKIGFRNGMLATFTLLTIGYLFLALFHSKMIVLFFLMIVMLGASFIKPLITGTVAKTTATDNRARGYSLFYWVVNIGSFSGKTFVPFIRQGFGLENVYFFSAAMALFALLFALFFYNPQNFAGEKKSVRQIAQTLLKVVKTPRLIFLILIVSGFWITQGQLYASMPKYVIRLLGEQAKPEWLANVNPLVVVLFVVLITQLMRRKKAVTSIFIGMILMPLSAFAMSLGQSFEGTVGNQIPIFGLFSLHPLTMMMIVGIGIQGLAECFISPRYLEYFSLQAPKGEEGIYLGFSHLYNFVSALAGFIMSGFLLDAYCPDPKTLPVGISEVERASYYAHAHYIWYYFLAIGFAAAIALYIFKNVTERIDKKKTASS
ncbi:MAG: MFS transporter [Ignavibacteriales bacterium]|nr:MAG: MFS transporter [Ignavibacteriales bacterium]